MTYKDIIRDGRINVQVEIMPLNDKRKIVIVRRFLIWMENYVEKKVLEKFGKVTEYQKLMFNDNPYM